MVKRKPCRRFQPDILIRAIFHNPLADHCDFRIIFFHILLPLWYVSITIACQKQCIHKLVQQHITIGVFRNAISRDSNTVVNSALTDCLLKLFQILRNPLFPDRFVYPHQTVNSNSEKLRDVWQQLYIRIADTILPT